VAAPVGRGYDGARRSNGRASREFFASIVTLVGRTCTGWRFPEDCRDVVNI
jgi:hypothetical protein